MFSLKIWQVHFFKNYLPLETCLIIVIYKVLLYTLLNFKIITIKWDRVNVVTAPAFIFLFLVSGAESIQGLHLQTQTEFSSWANEEWFEINL